MGVRTVRNIYSPEIRVCTEVASVQEVVSCRSCRDKEKAKALREEMGKCISRSPGIWDQTPKEIFTEITLLSAEACSNLQRLLLRAERKDEQDNRSGA